MLLHLSTIHAGLRSFDASSVHQILQCKLQPFHAVALQPFQGTLIFGAGHGLSICPLNEHSHIKSKAFKFKMLLNVCKSNHEIESLVHMSDREFVRFRCIAQLQVRPLWLLLCIFLLLSIFLHHFFVSLVHALTAFSAVFAVTKVWKNFP